VRLVLNLFPYFKSNPFQTWPCAPSSRFISLFQKQSNQIFILLALYLFGVSGVKSERCPSSWLCARAHTSRLQRWRVVGNVWERFDRFVIWTPYLHHQRQTSYNLCHLAGYSISKAILFKLGQVRLVLDLFPYFKRNPFQIWPSSR